MPTKPLRLDAVHLICQDLAKMEAFYTGLLGIERRRELVPFPDGPQTPWIELKTGSASLVLKPHGTYDGDKRTPDTASVHVGFRVATSNEVDERYEQLTAQGVKFETPPTDWPWNERACFLRDPEGNLVEIYYGDKPAPEPQDPRHVQGAKLILDAVHVPCNDLAKQFKFYSEAFGLERRRDMVPFPDGPQDPWPEFKTGRTSVVLKPHGPYDGNPRPETAAGFHFGFRAETPEDVDAYFKALSERGVKFAAEPIVWPWNERACFFHDAEGNLIEIYYGEVNPLDAYADA